MYIYQNSNGIWNGIHRDYGFMSSDLFLVQRQRDCHFMMWLLLCLLLIGFLDIKCHNTYKAVNKFYRSYILDLDIQCM